MARPASPELTAALEAFVCVRVVKMQGTALAQFQFDFDQTWTVFFLNADKTIYGRYGSRSAVGAESEKHVALGREVGVKGCAGDAGRPGDLVDRGSGVPA